MMCPPSETVAQRALDLLKEAQALEKTFREEEALRKYVEVVRLDPKNIGAACKASELYTITGKRQEETEKQREYYRKAVDYAKIALKLNANSAEANFVMAISMGRMAQISSGEDKIKAVKDIRLYAEKSIQLDPAGFKGYHILAKWHYEVSDLSTLEKWLVKVTYGALPKASLAESIKYYEKSLELNPGFLLNYLELAKAYIRNNQKNKARVLLEKLQQLNPVLADDSKIKSEGRKLLGEL